MRSALVALAAALSAAPTLPQAQPVCSAPVAVPVAVKTPGATYYSDGLPPERFRKNNKIMVEFAAQDRVNQFCGIAPCGMVMLACQSDNPKLMILPNPCGYGSGDQYAQLVCHELGHLNGWPATHGD